MFYFDNEYLGQYLDLKKKVTVNVDGEVLTIPSKSDIKDPQQGTGYDESGNPSIFDYRDIESIYVGAEEITIDMLQGEGEPEKQPSKSKPEPKPEDDLATEEEPEKEKSPEQQLAHAYPTLVGRLMIRDYFNSKRKK